MQDRALLEPPSASDPADSTDGEGGRAAAAYAAALRAIPLYQLLKIDVHPAVAHRACWFCGAFPVPPPKGPAQRAEYLDCLAADLALTARHLNGRGRPAVVAFGAGAPAPLSPVEVGAVLDAIEAELGLTDLTAVGYEIADASLAASDAAAMVAVGVSRFTVFASGPPSALAGAADFDALEAQVTALRDAGAADVGVAFCIDQPHRAPGDAAAFAALVASLGPDRIVAHRSADRQAVDPSLAAVAPPRFQPLPERAVHGFRATGYAEIAGGVFVRPERALERAAHLDARLDRARLGFGAGSLSRLSGVLFRKTRDAARYCSLAEAGRAPLDHVAPAREEVRAN